MYAEQATVSTDRIAVPSGDRVCRASQEGRRRGPVGGSAPAPAETPDATPQLAELLKEVDWLRARLLTQPVIEQAKGVLVGFYGIDPDTAFTVLVRWSQHTNTKLRLLAENLVEAAVSAEGESQAGLRELLHQLTDLGGPARATADLT